MMTSSVLSTVILLSCALKLSVSQTVSCKGRCGGEYYRGESCQCDYNCLAYRECCKDYESQCTTRDSCKGRCGETFKRGSLCSCDADCMKYKQCCPDFDANCAAEDPTLTTAGLSSTFSEGNQPDDSLLSEPTEELGDDMFSNIVESDDFSNNGIENPEVIQDPDSSSDGYGLPTTDPLAQVSTEPTQGSHAMEITTETLADVSKTESTLLDGTKLFTVQPTTAAVTTESADASDTDKKNPQPTTAPVLDSSKPTSTSVSQVKPTNLTSTSESETEEQVETQSTEASFPLNEPEATTILLSTQNSVTILENSQVTTTPPSSAPDLTTIQEENTSNPKTDSKSEDATNSPTSLPADPEETSTSVSSVASGIPTDPSTMTSHISLSTSVSQDVTTASVTPVKTTADPADVTPKPTSPQKPEPTPQDKPEPKPESEPQDKPEPKPESEPQDKPEPTPQDKPEPTPQDKPEPTPQDKPEPTPQNKPKPTPQDKPEPTPQDKPEPTPQDKPEPTPQNKPKPTLQDKPEPTPQNKPKPTPQDKPEPKPESEPQDKPEPTPQNKPKPTPQDKPEPTPQNKPKPTPQDKPEPNPQDKPNPEKPVPAKPSMKPMSKPQDAAQRPTDDPKNYQSDDSHDTNLCSGRPISGVTTLRNGTIVVFRGHYFWILDANRVPGPAQGITQVWGVPSPIDTVFTRCNCQGKTYIFKGGRYWRFENDVVDPGYPRAVQMGFDGLQGHVTGALSVPQYQSRRESVYFFKRGGVVQKYSYQFGTSPSCGRKVQYAFYTVRNRKARQAVSVLGPTINIQTSWRGFPSTVTAAVSIPSSSQPEGYKYYVFSGSKSYQVRMDGERPAISSPAAASTSSQNNIFKCPRLENSN